MGIIKSIKCSSKWRINTPIISLLILSNPPPYNREQIPKIGIPLTTRPPNLIHAPWGTWSMGGPT